MYLCVCIRDVLISGRSPAEPQEAGGSWRKCSANLEISVAGFTGAIVCPAEWQSICACDGAYAHLATVGLACPEPYSPATCGNAECETAISGIDDATLALMKTGFTACGNLPDSDWRQEVLFSYRDQMNYGFVKSIASQCGLTAAVKLTAPPRQESIDKCERAYKAFVTFNTSCPGTPQGTYSPATCVIDACMKAIVQINDETLKWMTSGFWACDDLDVGDPRKSYKSYAKDFSYTYLHQRAKACGIPQSVVQLTPCSLCGKDSQVPDASKGTFLAHGCSVDGITQEKSSDRASCKQQGGKDDTYQIYTCGSYEASLKEKFWLYEGFPNRCQKERDQKLYGSGDKIFEYADSKTSHCQCPGATPPQKQTQTPTQPPTQPQTQPPPQITTIYNTDVTHVVKVTLSLPMRKADFTSDKQTLFKKSLAAAAGKGVLEADVTIEIEPINGGRRLLAESITVRSTIKVPSQAAADTMAKDLTQEKINDELSKSGLPAAKLLDVAATIMKVGATPETESFADKVKSEATSAIIGGAIAGVVSLAGLLATYFRKWISSKCGCSGESDQNQEPLAEQKATAGASTVTSEVTVEASAVASVAANTRARTENPV
jgi:hypothetical protein